jgi:hypothetical protein
LGLSVWGYLLEYMLEGALNAFSTRGNKQHKTYGKQEMNKMKVPIISIMRFFIFQKPYKTFHKNFSFLILPYKS